MLAMRKKLAVIGTAICLCAVALGVAIFVGGPDPLRSKARRQWKDNAIVQIAKQTSDPAAILKEIEVMKTTPPDSEWWDTWISEDLIVMTNGQWMAYRNVCQKEDDRIRDLFLGFGSDGRWYYSTFHFCVKMQNLSVAKDIKALGPPRNLTEFSKQYYLREFDGHSDECLKDTRPKH
jgi:hypothetical protein